MRENDDNEDWKIREKKEKVGREGFKNTGSGACYETHCLIFFITIFWLDFWSHISRRLKLRFDPTSFFHSSLDTFWLHHTACSGSRTATALEKQLQKWIDDSEHSAIFHPFGTRHGFLPIAGYEVVQTWYNNIPHHDTITLGWTKRVER